MSSDGGPFVKRVLVGLRREKRLKAALKELSAQFGRRDRTQGAKSELWTAAQHCFKFHRSLE